MTSEARSIQEIPEQRGHPVGRVPSRMSGSRRSDVPIVAGAAMTPMIDVVFLLIIFFMLVAQIARQQIVELTLPSYEPSAAVPVLEDGRLVVNIVPREDRVRLNAIYIAGGLSFAPGGSEAGRLVEVLRATAQRQRAVNGAPVEVLLRAGEDEPYGIVHGAMELIRQSGIATVHLMSLDESAAIRLTRPIAPVGKHGGAAR